MRCPFCSNEETKVVDSRPADSNRSVRRRRECSECGGRFTTYERYEMQPIMVVKRDKSREIYNRDKILRGLVKASEKRNVSIEELSDIVADVDMQLRKTGRSEITSEEIGKMTMELLKNLDSVAYIRFASVYRDFKDIDQFKEIIDELRKGGEY